MTVWSEVDFELAEWRRQGLVPRFWWRDDDAVEPTPALDRLAALAGAFDVPLLLAVIPAAAAPALALRLADEPLVTVCQHGYAHRNHAPDGAPPLELDGDRAAGEVLDELAAGRRRLAQLFGAGFSTILAPPWNRIAPGVAARIHEVGFAALSTWSWHEDGTRLPQLNAQIDVIDWANGRIGRTLPWAAGELLRRLRQARQRGGAPLGILSHHLVQDEAAWATLAGLVRFLKVERGVAFETADRLAAALTRPCDTDRLRP